MRRVEIQPRPRPARCNPRFPLALAALAAAALLASLAPSAAVAAPAPGDPAEPPPPQTQRSSGPGFAFGAPKGYFVIKAGWLLPRAESDIYTFNAEQLTLGLDSYNAPMFGMDIGVVVNDRVDVVFGFEFSSTAPASEFRDFVDEFDAPIVQQTRLRQAPLTAGVRVNLVSRGRGVGNYAWVPATVVPYVGGGGGFTWWRYEQFGDFVDFFDLTIFTDHFLTQGWAPSAHVLGGLDLAVSPRFVVNFEGRYSWASGQLAPAFTGFEPIDLAGFRVTVGAAFRF
jgi:opacity protein-like surface antigen